MRRTSFKLIIVAGLFLSAQQVFAQTNTFKNIVIDITDFLGGAVMPLLFLFGLTWFVWGVVDFIRNADNQEKRKKGRSRMLWGIIALFVMVSYLGITSVFTQSLFNSNPILPQLYEENN